jgi:hypothetical protein
MTLEQARIWIVLSSLIILFAASAFFLVAPATGFPLDWQDSIRMIQLIAPTLLAYLGSAANFIINAQPVKVPAPVNPTLFGLLVRGPVYFFIGVFVISVVAFWLTNRPSASAGSGMSPDSLAWALSFDLGMLAAVTNVVTFRIFGAPTP